MGKKKTKEESDSNFRERVYRLVKMVPKGKVVTYGQIALLLGIPRAARAVGWVMALTPEHLKVPCQRVIYRHGGLAKSYGYGGLRQHRKDLEADGVRVRKDYTVDLSEYQWWPEGKTLKRLELPPEIMDRIVKKIPFGSGLSYRATKTKTKQRQPIKREVL